MVAKESFLIYGKWEDAIMRLSNESKGQLLTALFRYHNTGEEIDMSLDAQMAFLFIKTQMDIDAQKYDKTCAQRAAAGKKSAERKASQKARKAAHDMALATKSTNVEFVEKNQQNQQTPTKSTEKENEKEKDKEKDVCEHTTRVNCTHTQIEKYKQELLKKFFVPGITDAACRVALNDMRKLPMQDVMDAANGVPAGYNNDFSKELWRTGSRELDIAAGYRVWIERIVAKHEGGNK